MLSIVFEIYCIFIGHDWWVDLRGQAICQRCLKCKWVK